MPADPDRPHDEDRLDPGLVDALHAAWREEPVPADSLARVKQRVLRRVAEAEVGRHLTVQPGEGRWRDLGNGLSLKVLHRDGPLMSYLVRLAPGSALPPHRHPVDEECLVLEGELQIGDLRLGPGGFHLGRQGVPHAPVRSAGGALIYLRGAVPDVTLLL